MVAVTRGNTQITQKFCKVIWLWELRHKLKILKDMVAVFRMRLCKLYFWQVKFNSNYDLYRNGTDHGK